MTDMMNEIGFYTLAGAPRSPRDLIGEVQDAERMGIGAFFISERFNIKEAATLSGAVGAVSEKIGIATAATNHNTRHPIVTAAYATTMHFLTGGRFSLGLGRGIDVVFDAFGLPRITTKQLEDFAGVARRLFKGETIVGHDGPCGKYPVLRLDPAFDEYIPLSFTAFGPNSLALGGRAFDAVILHTFFTDETTARCVKAVKEAAEQAGRNP
ncbi:MAG: TIGR03857 family LLM class F420-dependent oxidoreductase, partial [Pseudomonadales bacterium]|nr:TIGR03857 family LLM class F420-dependent oxidoreductase [Pseudomonadales bacterium]